MRWNYLQMVALIILLMDYFVTVVEVKAVKADNMWLDSGVGQITRFTLDYKGIHKKSVHQTTKNFTKKEKLIFSLCDYSKITWRFKWLSWYDEAEVHNKDDKPAGDWLLPKVRPYARRRTGGRCMGRLYGRVDTFVWIDAPPPNILRANNFVWADSTFKDRHETNCL